MNDTALNPFFKDYYPFFKDYYPFFKDYYPFFNTQVNRKLSGHQKVEVDKTKEGLGHGLDMATWMRTGAVGMPKKTIDPATGHVVGASRQATDLTVLVGMVMRDGMGDELIM